MIVCRPRFALGCLVMTPGAQKALVEAGQEPSELLARHVQCDWGEVDTEDREANDQALYDGGRLVSAYRTATDVWLWVITEGDRSSTCILLPHEY